MSNKKELNKEELEKVTGGEGEGWQDTNNVMVKYQDTVDGMTLTKDLGRYVIAYAEENGEAMAKEWCTLNNKIYVGWYLANLTTLNYETRVLLDKVS